ncbi:LD-carboxypeptidase [Agromyces sp. Root81]|uniref:S66 peptidase family protein n=1 Tax=Agromyces sp. Root81 TaxID=1736601 RepID=UPI000A8B2650|nr:S66 peptidase family protein [Agromyces sp. Root81]
MLRPRALRPGDTVAVAALSGGLDAEEEALFARGVAELEGLGFAVQISPLVEPGRHWWWGAATPADLAGEFNRLLRDPEVRAIFALTGGRMTLGYLDLIDFAAVEADPKPVIGFSDIDVVLLALHARTGLVGVHGDLVTFGYGEWHQAGADRRQELADLSTRMLTSSLPVGLLPSDGEWECWRGGRVEGPLIGGLLNRLVRLQATPFALPLERFDGAILFWEDVNTSTSAIWNDLHVLRSAGILDRVSGMLVGPVADIEVTEGGPGLREVVLDVLGGRDIPVLANLEIGHAPPNIPLPLGVRAELDADAGSLALLESAVSGR